MRSLLRTHTEAGLGNADHFQGSVRGMWYYNKGLKSWGILIHFFFSTRKTNCNCIKIAWILAAVSLWNRGRSHIRGRATLRSGMITQHSGVDCLLNLSAPWQRSVVVPRQRAGAAKARETERHEEGHDRNSGVTDLGLESIWIRKCLLHDAEYQLGC